MTNREIEKMIARYVRRGGKESTGRKILDDILRTVGSGCLDAALKYQGFK